MTFEHKNLASPFEVVFTACVYLTYWAGLMKGEDRLEMERGAAMLKENAKTMMRLCAFAHVDSVLE